MLKDIKKTSKDSIIYALGNIATKAIGFILIPIFTNPKYFSQADYGVLAVLDATVQLLVGLLSLSLAGSLLRWYWDKKYVSIQKSMFFTTLIFHSSVIIPVILSLAYFSDFFSNLIFNNTTYAYLLKLTFLSAGSQILQNQILSLAKAQFKSGFYSIIRGSNFFLKLLLILWWVAYKKRGLEAVWEAYAIIEVLTLIVLLPYAIKNITVKFQKKVLLEMLSYGFPLMLASISSVILVVTDRYMLNSMSGLEHTAIYSLGLKFANTLKIVITTSLLSALNPMRMQKISEPNNQRFYAKNLTYTGFIFIIFLLGLSLFSLEMIKVFTGTTKYWAANGIIPIISFALLFDLLRNMVIMGLLIQKKTKVVGVLIFLSGLLNIGLNTLLIPIWDIYGAAIATLISQIFFFLSLAIRSQKVYFIPYEWLKLIKMIALAIIYISIGLFISNQNVVFRLLIKSFLVFSFPFVLYFLKFYEKIELQRIHEAWRKWKNPLSWKENIKKIKIM